MKLKTLTYKAAVFSLFLASSLFLAGGVVAARELPEPDESELHETGVYEGKAAYLRNLKLENFPDHISIASLVCKTFPLQRESVAPEDILSDTVESLKKGKQVVYLDTEEKRKSFQTGAIVIALVGEESPVGEMKWGCHLLLINDQGKARVPGGKDAPGFGDYFVTGEKTPVMPGKMGFKFDASSAPELQER